MSSPTREQRLAELAEKDVEAIGSHCDVELCHRLDFLPFKCESCKGTFCLDHRTETSHSCPKAGAYLASLRPSAPSTTTTTTHRRQGSLLSGPCSAPKCKTTIDTPLNPGVDCQTCRKRYCLAHRLQDQHDCKPPPPKPAAAAAAKTKAAALSGFRKFFGSGSSGSKSGESLGTRIQTATAPVRGQKAKTMVEVMKMKKEAKGDERVPLEKRVYLHVQAEARSTTSKLPSGVFWMNKEWSVGRVLDQAAERLGLKNENNVDESEEKRLRVFHVEGGRVLSFGEKVGDILVDGNTIVLLRGLHMPDLM